MGRGKFLGRMGVPSLIANNIGSILDEYVAQYWLHIVRNIYPILDSSHFNNCLLYTSDAADE